METRRQLPQEPEDLFTVRGVVLVDLRPYPPDHEARTLLADGHQRLGVEADKLCRRQSAMEKRNDGE